MWLRKSTLKPFPPEMPPELAHVKTFKDGEQALFFGVKCTIVDSAKVYWTRGQYSGYWSNTYTRLCYMGNDGVVRFETLSSDDAFHVLKKETKNESPA